GGIPRAVVGGDAVVQGDVLDRVATASVAEVRQRHLQRGHHVAAELLGSTGQRPRGVELHCAGFSAGDVLDVRVANEGALTVVLGGGRRGLQGLANQRRGQTER